MFGVALAVGTQVGPIAEPAEHTTHEHGTLTMSERRAYGEPQTFPGGLMTSDHGYTLSLETDQGRGRTSASRSAS